MKYRISSDAITTDFELLREEDKPYSRIAKFGAETLTDEELAMCVIGSGTSKNNVADIAINLISAMEKIPEISVDELIKIPGLGKSKASAIIAAIELSRRFCKKPNCRRQIISPGDVYREVWHYASREQENMIVVMLNGAHEVIDTVVATTGILNRTLVHPREIFATAIEKRAAAVAIAHNHPSGNSTPSNADVDMTKQLAQALDVVGIKLEDHLVITTNGYFSMRERAPYVLMPNRR